MQSSKNNIAPMMIQNYLVMDFNPLKFSYPSFYMLVSFCYLENFCSFYYFVTKLEIIRAETSANVQKAIPLPQTSSIDPVESYMSGVNMLFTESNKKGIHTPMPIKES